MTNVTIGFIGYGNMAQGLVQGLIASGTVKPEQIFACAAHYDKLLKNTADSGVQPMKTSLDVVHHSDIIVLAVKPNLIETVVSPIKKELKKKVVVSVAVNYPFDRYEEILEAGTHHISTIPNTPVAVREGILVCENKHSLTEEEKELFIHIFSPVALLEWVDTKQLSIAGTLSGCTPAFTAIYMEALADAAVKHGLPRGSAYRLAAQVLSGTGKLYLSTGEHPGQLKDAVCSPGGTTIKGVASLEKDGFRGCVIGAIDAIEG